MRRRYGKVGRTTLIAFACLSLSLFLLESQTKKRIKTHNYEEKVKAVEMTKDAFRLIREEKIALGLGIDSVNDPNFSGLVGSAHSPITMSRRGLDEVLLSTAPNFAGIFVSLLKKEGAKVGETILVCVDGSFPGVYISFLAAAQVLSLNPFIIGSLTASSWGANHPSLTYLDMERIVRSAGLFPFATRYVSLGGEDDAGLGLEPFARDLLVLAAERQGIPIVEPNKKFSLYPKTAKIFLNIGNSASARVLISEAKKKRMRILDFSRLKNKLANMGIEEKDLFAPIGKGRVFEEERYSVIWAIIFSLIILLALFFIIRYDLEFYLLPKKEREKIEEEEAI